MDWCKALLFIVGCQLLCCPTVTSSVAVTAFKDLDQYCSKEFEGKKQGNFTSHKPGFKRGEKYPKSQRCGWMIESPEAVADIFTTFHFFDLALNKRCNIYDHVHIYKKEEGFTSWTMISPISGYCGKLPKFSVPAKAKFVYVRFDSDDIEGDNGYGFNASFEIKVSQAQPKIKCIGRVGVLPCNRTVEVEENELVTIQCHKEGLPSPTVKWMKVTKGIQVGNATKTNDTYSPIRKELVKTRISNGSIQLHNIQMGDKGIYLCTAENKLGSVSSEFELIVREQCLCPKNIKVYWYRNPPYTRYKDEGYTPEKKCLKGLLGPKGDVCYKGILYTVLNDMIATVCGECLNGHGESTLDWDEIHYKSKKLSDVKNAIVDKTSTYDIYLPIEGGKDDIRYRSSYYFLPMIESPGIAFMIVKEPDGTSSQAIFDSILDGWPILVLTIVMAMLSGIIMWMLDTYWNEEQFPRSIHEGVAEGFWWAFVTMTTVGYGDIAPLGVPGRLFAIIWILTGLVIIAIFTSVITTSLTVVSLSSGKKLYGSVVAAITDSSEFRMGVTKNAEMKNFSTLFGVADAMNERSVIGSLIDSYVAAYKKKMFSNFRVNNIFVSNKAYGIVLGKRMSKSHIYNKLSRWVESHKAEITQKIEDSTETLKEPGGSAAMEASANLFNPSNLLFVNSIIGTCVILVILVVGGLLFEYGYLRPRHRMIESAKNLEMVESRQVKEMAFRARCLKEVLLGQVGEFYERWNDRLKQLSEKHKAEKKLLLARGTPAAPSKWQSPMGSQDELVGLDRTDSVDSRPGKSPEYSTTVGL